jgi:subtilase family serine protease
MIPSIMIRRWIAVSLAAVVFVPAVLAQSLPALTRHVREATVNGRAPMMGRLPATQQMRLVLTLPLRNEEELDRLLQDLYDPSSPLYRQFLAVEQFTEKFGPTREDYDAAIRFAEANAFTVTGRSRNRVNMNVTAAVSDVEKAFHLKMGVYQHPTENRTFYAPDREPVLDLNMQLWHISGLDNYAIPKPMLEHTARNARSNATTGSGPDASFLGSDMRGAYYGGTLTGAGQSVGLLEYVGTDLTDLDTYYANVHQTESVPITLLSTDGTSTSCVDNSAGGDCDDTEQTLDMTQALGMAPGMSSLVMYVGSSDAAILNAMATAKPLNAQLSSSWVWGPPADPKTDDPYFEEFAAQGQNYFQAAGDWGEWSSTLLNDGAIYPSDDVYITSVGGTDLNTSSAGGPWASETAWSDSGGGISPDDFKIPLWQTAAAAGCLSCSQSYRNGPDVAANANFTFYVCADQTTCTENYWGGTSFAAPMWAGYMALVNQQTVINSGKTLGFINSAIYTIGLGANYDSDFHDTTSGCQESGGYCATTGYDLVTGWGSPNGPSLLNALAGTPAASFALSASPDAFWVALGSSANSTVTSTPNGGFNSAVSLSASNQPAGVTVNFNPTSITGSGTSTMTVSAVSSTAPGTYTFTVTGTSGSIAASTTVSITVAKGPYIHIGHGN